MKKKLLEKQSPEVSGLSSEHFSKEFFVIASLFEQDLIVDVLCSREKRHVKRIVIAKNNFATYDPLLKEWNERSFENNIFTPISNTAISEASCFISNEAKSVVFSYREKAYGQESWTHAINRYQQLIRQSKDSRNQDLRMKRLKERQKEIIEDLPEDFINWMERKVSHFLFYNKKRNNADCKCTACNQSFNYPYRFSGSYEDQFKKRIDEPRKDYETTCPNCKVRVTFLPFGAKKCRKQVDQGYFVQRYKEKGIVLRYFEIERHAWPDEGIDTKTEITEIARMFYHRDEKVQTDFYKWNPYTGKNFWDDCNLYGMSNIRINKAEIFWPSLKNLRDTDFQYSALDEYLTKTYRKGDFKKYLFNYMTHPEMELLTKMGYIEMVDQIQSSAVHFDMTKKKPHEILGIYSSRIMLLREKEGNVQLYSLLRAEKFLGDYWSKENLSFIVDNSLSEDSIKAIRMCMTLEKFINRVYRYAEVQEGYPIWKFQKKIKEIAQMYADMLNMLILNQDDITKYTNLYPKDLKKKHDELALVLNEKQNLEVKTLKNIEFCNIQKVFEKFNDLYAFEEGELLIRPAFSAREIIEEGQILHHCVGGDGYLKRHHEGKGFIFVLRKKSNPDEPYVTVEWAHGSIVQWYGMLDKKVDFEINSKWLKKWSKIAKQRESDFNQNIA